MDNKKTNIINASMTIEQKKEAFKTLLLKYNENQKQKITKIVNKIPTNQFDTNIETAYKMAIQYAQENGFSNINYSEYDKMVLNKIQKYHMKTMSIEQKKQELIKLLVEQCSYREYEIENILGKIQWENINDDFPKTFYDVIYSFPPFNEFLIYAKYAHNEQALNKIYNKLPILIVEKMSYGGYDLAEMDICSQFYDLSNNYTDILIKYIDYTGGYNRPNAFKAGIISNNEIANNFIKILKLNKNNTGDYNNSLLGEIDWTKSGVTVEILTNLYKSSSYKKDDVIAIFVSDYNGGIYEVYEKYKRNYNSDVNLSEFNKLMNELKIKRYNNQVKNYIKDLPAAVPEASKFMMHSLFKKDWN